MPTIEYEIDFVTIGGTVLMALNDQGFYVPAYDVRHVAIAMEIDRLLTEGLTELEAEAKRKWAEGLKTEFPGNTPYKNIDSKRGDKLDKKTADELIKKLVATKREVFNRANDRLEQELDMIVSELNSFTFNKHENLALLVSRHGFSGDVKVDSPFVIDSINHNTDVNQPSLHKSIEDMFFAGQVDYEDRTREIKKVAVVVFGGTDSLQWYAGLEAKDMHRRGWFDKGNKLIFTSSMRSFEEDSLHCARVIKGAKRVARNKAVMGGAYAVSARDPEANDVDVLVALRDLIKIDTGIDAFRGIKVCTSQSDGFIVFDEGYVKYVGAAGKREELLPRRIPPVSGPTKYARIAPPILAGNSTSEILTLLGAYTSAEKRFDAIIIEGLPGVSGAISGDKDLAKIEEAIVAITQAGTRVVINNNLMLNRYYKESEEGSQLIVPTVGKKWQEALEVGGYLHKLKEKCGDRLVISQQVPNNAYNEALLEFAAPDGETRTGGLRIDIGENNSPVTLGIRYTPSIKAFQDGMELAYAALVRTTKEEPKKGLRGAFSRVFSGAGSEGRKPKPRLVISGLPGNCVAEENAAFLSNLVGADAYTAPVEIVVTFDYNGVTRNGRKVGVADNKYAAAQACARYAKPSPNNPQEAMRAARKAFIDAGMRR